ncbi:MAG TPA: hypothetical protein VGJ84_07830, partial [Polyangiaceae bacterium]
MQLEGVKSRGALLLGISALAGVAIGWLLIPRAPSPDDPKAPAPEVRFLGRPLPADDLARPRALDWLRRYVAQPVTLALPDGVRRQVYLGRL